MTNNEHIQSLLNRIDSLLISDKFFSKMTEQSCDCDEIIVKSGEKYVKLTSKPLGEDACIAFEEVGPAEADNYPYAADLDRIDFFFDKTVGLDCGKIEGVRFSADGVFLFIFASEHNLILTMSKYDLFEEIEMDFPEEEATLSIVKR